MPLFKNSSFKAPFYFSNRHFQTIYPSLFRKVDGVEYTRERFTLSDGDFIDLDYSKINTDQLVIVLHGLEGASDRPYVKGMVKIFNEHGFDAMGLNFRGCSGESNLLPETYHSGKTDDLDEVIQNLAKEGVYKSVILVGFSLGGNVIMKYVGEQGFNLNSIIKKAVAFSAPIHLETASYELAKWYNSIYMKRFMNNLKEKIKERENIVKDLVDLPKVYGSKSFLDFDENFTAPIHGFKGAIDYWTQSSSKQFLENIKIPTLLVNAKDDTFLSAACYPISEANRLKNFFFESPKGGGHVGFVQADEKGFYWSERRALAFVLKDH